jgi:hypothetical protein
VKNGNVGKWNVKKSIINRAQVFQDRIESRIRGLPVLGLGTYLFFLGYGFFVWIGNKYFSKTKIVT